MKEEEDESAMRPMARHEYTTEPPYRPVSYQLIRGLGRGGRGWKSQGRSRGEGGGAGEGGGGGLGLARLQCRPGSDPTLAGREEGCAHS